MNSHSQQRYEFGPFQVDMAEHSLLRDGKPVPLTPKVFDLLKVLVQNNGRLVEKDELLKEVWPDSFVEEGNLNRNISILRKALGEDSSGETYIETVPKRGYRFVASVKTTNGNGAGAVAETHNQNSEVCSLAAVENSPESSPSKRQIFSRGWLVVGGLVALSIGTAAYFLVERQGAATSPKIRSIAVLPLENLSGDAAQEYFADGMTEALISNLAQIRALRVISRTSVMSFKERKKPLPPLPEIARELKVDGVIEGSVQRENGRVKVTIQLIHGLTDTHLWARDYERELTDALKLQGEIARAIADAIRIQVTPDERVRMSSKATVTPAAHEAYLLGRYYHWKNIIDDHRRAISYFERAIQIDPDFAPAYAGLSLTWQKLGVQSRGAFGDLEPQARAAAEKALELDDRLAEAYVARGHLQFFYDWDWAGAENSLRRAFELDPNNLDAHYHYSVLLMCLGRIEASMGEIQFAEQLDPLSPQVQIQFGRVLHKAGRLDEALVRLKQAIEREPRSHQAYVRLAALYVQMGKYTEAIEIFDKARVLRGIPGDKRGLAVRARVYALMGKRAEAQRMLKGLEVTTTAAGAHVALGNTDEAFRLLFRLVEERKDYVFTVKSDPQFASLRSDPRWKELLVRMKLPVD
jgi:TolB-like protein/DNA-binding winged helix-turn-helix (wHTH) protein/Tfp pilus assembly protein PilF